MATLRIEREQATNAVILRLEGMLDGAAALMLTQALGEVSAPELVLDFSRVREFKDMAVAVLAPALQASARALRIRGMGSHHARMFRYFGVPVAEQPRGYGRAEELLLA